MHDLIDGLHDALFKFIVSASEVTRQSQRWECPY